MRACCILSTLLLSVALLTGCGGKSIPEDPGIAEGTDLRDNFNEAILNEDAELVAELLAAQPLLATAPHPISGQWPIHTAVRVNNEAIVKTLMENGADPYALNDEGETAEDVARNTGSGESVMALLQ